MSSVILGLKASEFLSCPFLSVFDGVKYNLDNDIISVGRTPANEYTDYLFIKNSVAESEGKIKLRIDQSKGETGYLDYLKLVLINHPTGTKAGVDEHGNAHTYSNALSPMQATSNGADVLDKVLNDDNQGVLLYNDEYIDVTFSPANLTLGAKFILKADGFERSTTLPVHSLGQLPAIEIQTEESGIWVTRSRFFPKEYNSSGVFDLKPYLDPANPKVRLLYKSCATNVAAIVDYAALDNSADTLSTTPLSLSKAVLKDGTDVLNLVNSIDSNYLQLVDESCLDLEFDSVLSSEEKSYYFISKGYYELTGNTFAVYTKDEFGNWAYRWESSYYDTEETKEVDLSEYVNSNFPTPCGTYNVLVYNYGYWYMQWSYVNYIYLIADGNFIDLKSAVDDSTQENILDLVKYDDYLRWEATNRAINLAFTVPDIEPPQIACPEDITVNNDPGICGAVVTFPAPTVNDNCEIASVTYSMRFPVGITTVTTTATNNIGNQNSCSFDVIVYE